MNSVTVVGAGLAGCEAALQLSAHGFHVKLYDAKPEKLLPAYNFKTYAELVCNSSVGNMDVTTPSGLLLYELELLGSRLIKIAKENRVRDGSFLAVDKKAFSLAVTKELLSANIDMINRHIEKVPDDDHVIIASGPLTERGLAEDISKKFGAIEYFFSDASSPVIDIRSVDMTNKAVMRLSEDLYAVLLSDMDLEVLCRRLVLAKKPVCRASDREIDFDKCKSIEMLAEEGIAKLTQARLIYPDIAQPCLLLRRESGLESGFILVGCMTTLPHGEQKNIFSTLPGLRNIRFIKYGRMHRNTFFHSAGFLNRFYQIGHTNVYIVGQLSGIDGYAPAISSGLVAACRIIHGETMPVIPADTMIGGLAKYVSNSDVTDFQPICASFSLLEKHYTNNYYENSKRAVEKFLTYLKI